MQHPGFIATLSKGTARLVLLRAAHSCHARPLNNSVLKAHMLGDLFVLAAVRPALVSRRAQQL
jgi:hypothetical protein